MCSASPRCRVAVFAVVMHAARACMAFEPMAVCVPCASCSPATVEKAIATFSRRFVSQFLNFRTIIARQLRAPELSRLSSRTHEPKTFPKALSALEASSDPVALFKARDVLRQSSKALFAKFSTVHGVFSEGSDDGEASKASPFFVSEAELQAALTALVPAASGDAKAKVRRVDDDPCAA